MQSNFSGIILFDGECVLCSKWVPFVIKRDDKAEFKFCSVQSPKGQELLNSLGLPTEDYQTMVLLKDGTPYYRSEAFFEVIKDLNKPWPWLRIFRVFPKKFRDWVYDRIALNRYKLFGKHNYCMIPTKDITDRFI
ncbi:thiol-disulfide oxidoreductase DCC family protein [Kangiella taiwanensis]|uniref:Thiol-disulfide oxidoreductase DCC family protein n=1 Tax=Kangiella taiwanensis TaxID=1079179 RepID=A0ABP8I3P7_9GAMM|nr:DCC1-like thiol-disulfide oxidoreductase family protein [Kangiella taiwanensis]